MPAGSALSLRSGDLRFTCSSSTAPALGLCTWLEQDELPGSSKSQIPQPGRRAAGTRLLCAWSRDLADHTAGSPETWEVLLHLLSPWQSLLHPWQLLALGSCLCMLPGLAGLTGPLQPWRGGSAILEEGCSLVAKQREGTCILLGNAALCQRQPGDVSFLGSRLQPRGFTAAAHSAAGGAEASMRLVLALFPATPAHSSARTRQPLCPIHPCQTARSLYLGCSVLVRGLQPLATAV